MTARSIILPPCRGLVHIDGPVALDLRQPDKAALVRQELNQRDRALPIGLEARHMLGDGVGEAQQPLLDQ